MNPHRVILAFAAVARLTDKAGWLTWRWLRKVDAAGAADGSASKPPRRAR